MPLDATAQHSLKLERLRDALRAHGLVHPAIELTRSSEDLGYRNRLRSKISAGRIELFNPNKVPSCSVLEPSLRALLSSLQAISRQEPELFSPFSHLELRSEDVEGRPGLALAAEPPEREVLRAALRRIEQRLPALLLGLRGDAEIACQRRHIAGRVWAFVPLDAFWQINTRVNEALVMRLCDKAHDSRARTALDLYAGAGNFSLPLAASGLEVLAVELHAPASRAMQRAAGAQGLPCTALAGRAELACDELRRSGRRFDLVIIDAPRAGLRDAAPSVAELRPQCIALISCNPVSLAHDLSAFAAAGYRIQQLHAFDMFPHTHHLEVFVWLERL
jgi:tRNA/tmRNA/rRNA uracil-C5-methylase (TrmA/RlmC/RlmD family)